MDVIDIYYLSDFLRSCLSILPSRVLDQRLVLAQGIILDGVHEHWIYDLDQVAWTEYLCINLRSILLIANEKQLRPLLGQLVLQLFQFRAKLQANQINNVSFDSVLLLPRMLALSHAKRLRLSWLRLQVRFHQVLQSCVRPWLTLLQIGLRRYDWLLQYALAIRATPIRLLLQLQVGPVELGTTWRMSLTIHRCRLLLGQERHDAQILGRRFAVVLVHSEATAFQYLVGRGLWLFEFTIPFSGVGSRRRS